MYAFTHSCTRPLLRLLRRLFKIRMTACLSQTIVISSILFLSGSRLSESSPIHEFHTYSLLLTSNLNPLNYTQRTSLKLWLYNVQFPPLIVLTRFSFSLSILSYIILLCAQSHYRNPLLAQFYVHLIKIIFRTIVAQSTHSFSQQNSIRLTLSHSTTSIPRQQWISIQKGNPQSQRCCFRKWFHYKPHTSGVEGDKTIVYSMRSKMI